ncbi:MAG TPA: peptidoglycan-binding protein [Acidimicrobiales bacterium]|jgi:peptidoglycan hydrolase-like protein with peptidoglycan-binding domain|nr:peptidoglycan-binding protein [Acidimicrobiales bacterium]
MRSTSQLRTSWGPPCQRELTTVMLHSGARIRVAVETVEAFRALDMVLQKHGYAPRSADTGGYNCRPVTGGKGFSLHACGIACDINWNSNPYRKDNKLVTDMSPKMVDDILGVRTAGGLNIFRWGGAFRTFKDAMHYEVVLTPKELATGIDWATVPSTRSRVDRPESFPVLQPGDTGPTVTKLQQMLAAAGFDPGAADGNFGPRTEVAVRAYQTSRRLDVDGIVGRQTWTALTTDQPAVPPKDSPVKRDVRVDPATRPTVQVGSSGDVVLDLQKRLAMAGFDPGPADGEFGPRTGDAVRAFQRAKGLKADGICGPRTWTALYAADAK